MYSLWHRLEKGHRLKAFIFSLRKWIPCALHTTATYAASLWLKTPSWKWSMLKCGSSVFLTRLVQNYKIIFYWLIMRFFSCHIGKFWKAISPVFSYQNLATLCHLDQLLLVTHINLSSNQLQRLPPQFAMLQCLEVIKLQFKSNYLSCIDLCFFSSFVFPEIGSKVGNILITSFSVKCLIKITSSRRSWRLITTP